MEETVDTQLSLLQTIFNWIKSNPSDAILAALLGSLAASVMMAVIYIAIRAFLRNRRDVLPEEENAPYDCEINRVMGYSLIEIKKLDYKYKRPGIPNPEKVENSIGINDYLPAGAQNAAIVNTVEEHTSEAERSGELYDNREQASARLEEMRQKKHEALLRRQAQQAKKQEEEFPETPEPNESSPSLEALMEDNAINCYYAQQESAASQEDEEHNKQDDEDRLRAFAQLMNEGMSPQEQALLDMAEVEEEKETGENNLSAGITDEIHFNNGQHISNFLSYMFISTRTQAAKHNDLIGKLYVNGEKASFDGSLSKEKTWKERGQFRDKVANLLVENQSTIAKAFIIYIDEDKADAFFDETCKRLDAASEKNENISLICASTHYHQVEQQTHIHVFYASEKDINNELSNLFSKE